MASSIEGSKTGARVYLRSYFTVVAAAIGTGVFALPVEIWRCGMGPFLSSYLLVIVVQIYFVWMIVEMMQRADIYLGDEAMTRSKAADSMETGQEVGVENVDGNAEKPEEEDDGQGEESALLGKPQPVAPSAHKAHRVEDVNLYSMSRVTLSRWLHYGWLVTIMLHHFGILVSYALAGGMSFGSMLGLKTEEVAHWFILGCFIVVTLDSCLKDVVSLLTMVKMTALVALVVGTAGIVSEQRDQDFTDDWKYAMHPFAMSNVAIGGVIWVVPFLYKGVRPIRKDVATWRAVNAVAVCSGAAIVLSWCVMVLFIVPQSGPAPSLEDAKLEGKIATVPVIEVILSRGSKGLQWAGKAAHGLVVTSVTISFIIFGLSLKNVLDGLVLSVALTCRKAKAEDGRGFSFMVGLCQFCALLLCFASVAGFVASNPKSFFKVLKIAVSLALCVGNLLIILMFYGSTKLRLSREPEVVLSMAVRNICWLTFAYYIFLILFTITAEILVHLKSPYAVYIMS